MTKQPTRREGKATGVEFSDAPRRLVRHLRWSERGETHEAYSKERTAEGANPREQRGGGGVCLELPAIGYQGSGMAALR